LKTVVFVLAQVVSGVVKVVSSDAELHKNPKV